KTIPFSVIRKESFEVENLEALLLGTAGLLEKEYEDVYCIDLKIRYYYLMDKYKISQSHVDAVEFFKHRPDNFPTIRLSQLANLYHSQQNLFSKIISLNSAQTVYDLVKISASSYWQTHYQFDKE